MDQSRSKVTYPQAAGKVIKDQIRNPATKPVFFYWERVIANILRFHHLLVLNRRGITTHSSKFINVESAEHVFGFATNIALYCLELCRGHGKKNTF